MQIYQTIATVLVEKYEIGEDRIQPSTEFDSLDLDSLVLAEISVILTNQLGIFITDDELAQAGTVGEAASRLTERLSADRAEA
jgi:acyl carrier protein